MTGSISNITEHSLTVGNLMKAVFNQLANNFVIASKKLLNDDFPVKKILFSGGVARKIKSIRDRIIDTYKVENYEIANDETLKGLFRYALKNL